MQVYIMFAVRVGKESRGGIAGITEGEVGLVME